MGNAIAFKNSYYSLYDFEIKRISFLKNKQFEGVEFLIRDYSDINITEVYFSVEINNSIKSNYQTQKLEYIKDDQFRIVYACNISNLENANLCIHGIKTLMGDIVKSDCYAGIPSSSETIHMKIVSSERRKLFADSENKYKTCSHKSYAREYTEESWRMYPEIYEYMDWLNYVNNCTESMISKFHHNIDEINILPPKDNDETITVPIECYYDKRCKTKLYMLRKYVINSAVISKYDLLEYQVNISVDNIELLVLLKVKQFGEEWFDTKDYVIGTDFCEDSDERFDNIFPFLGALKKTLKMINENINRTDLHKVIRASSEYKRLRQIEENLFNWINFVYDEFYEEYAKRFQFKRILKSEYRLYKYIQFLCEDAVYQYRTEWLNSQSIDIFIPSLNAAIEYQGEQHYNPIGYFGGEEGLVHRKTLDYRKKVCCEEKGIGLYYWPYTMHIRFSTVVDFLRENCLIKNLDEKFFKERLNCLEGKSLANELDVNRYKRISENNVVAREKKENPYEIRKYSMEGIFIENYENISSAAQANEMTNARISNAINGTCKSSGGFQWKKALKNDPNDNIEPVEYVINSGGKAVYQINSEGIICNEFESIRMASRITGIAVKGIERTLRGRQHTAGGYVWKYKDDRDLYRTCNLKEENNSKPIYQINRDGEIVAEYDSITSAAKIVGIDRKCIRDTLKGRQKTAAGYKWIYK